MSTKKARAMAYEAGRHALTEPPERRSVDANPFEPGSDESDEWLRGFSDALNNLPDPATLQKQLDDAMRAGDSV
jgi:truncated hemoglobin YjbI